MSRFQTINADSETRDGVWLCRKKVDMVVAIKIGVIENMDSLVVLDKLKNS